jgi:hypothetical protein
MPDNSTLPATGDIIAADEISGVKFQRIKLVLGADGVNAGDVASGNPMPVQASALPLPTGASTEATLAAVNAKLPTLSSGRVPVELPAGGAGLTNSELRATAVPVSGTFFQATQPVSLASWAGLTDTQLRATAVPVSFTWSGLTDAQLRASAVPVSGPLTDAQLRAAALALPANAATETTLAAVNAKLPALSGNAMPVTDADAVALLRQLLQMLIAPLGYDKSLGRQRSTAVIESGTLTTLTTLSNISSVGGYTAQMTVLDANRSAWAQCVRARIT